MSAKTASSKTASSRERPSGNGTRATKPAGAAMGKAAAWTILAFALAGIGIAIYLTIVHYAKVPLVCSNGGPVDCNAVTRSVYSNVGTTGIPITFPGMAWFIVSGSLAVVSLLAAAGTIRAPDWLLNGQLVWGLFGVVFVLYLIYVEAVLLHKICEWCTGIHVLVILTFLVTLAAWQRAMAARYAA